MCPVFSANNYLDKRIFLSSILPKQLRKWKCAILLLLYKYKKRSLWNYNSVKKNSEWIQPHGFYLSPLLSLINDVQLNWNKTYNHWFSTSQDYIYLTFILFVFAFPCMAINIAVYSHDLDKAHSEVKRQRYIMVLQG